MIENAFLLLQLGRAEEALEALSRDFDADDPWAWHARAAVLLALERHEDSELAAMQGLSRDPEHPYLLDALAAARIGRNDLPGAEDAILAALRLGAEDADLLTRYAHIVAIAGQLEKAEKLVLRALAIDPENPFALQMHALLATARGDGSAAIARSHELLRHVPEHPLAHRLLGAAHANSGRIEAAADHLGRAVYLDPSNDDVAEAAREARWRTHWLLWPLRPIMRWGPAPVWIAAVATMFALRALHLPRALTMFAFSWLAYCVYSWVMPSLVRKFAGR